MARTSRRRRVAVAAGALGALLAGTLATSPPVSAGPSATDESITITPDPSYAGEPFQGWGTSLVWFANATGGYPEQIRQRLADLVFGDQGLALNIARYNIGGGNAPDVRDYLRAGGAVPGWWKAPAGTTREDTDWWSPDDPELWNPEADRAQRWWVDRVKSQVDHWEAFSNSPPWFMTTSGYVSGGFDPQADQLKPDSVTDYTRYLIGVVERVERAHGIDIATLDPFNEPNGTWRTTLGPDGEPTGGRQEGTHMSPELQRSVLRALHEELRTAAVDPRISAMDESTPEGFAGNWRAYTTSERDMVGRLNVHTYGTGGRTTVRDLAKAADKPLWMSEVDGDWGQGQSFTDMGPGLGLARHIVGDLRELEPTAWLFWQPVEDYNNMKPGGESAQGGNWGTIQVPFDCKAGDTLRTCPVRTNTKFNTARNFTHYIKPGDRLVRTEDPASVAAVSEGGQKATVVHVNDSDAARNVTLDLSKFAQVNPDATVTPVVTGAGEVLQSREPVRVSGDRATISVPARTVTTFLVSGVSGVADGAGIQDGHAYRLTGEGSGKSLTVADDGRGVAIRDDRSDGAGQRWTFERITPGHGNRGRYVIREAESGRALAAQDGAAVLADEGSTVSQQAQWVLSTTGDGRWTFVNAGSGQLLDVAGAATHDGATVAVWEPNSGSNQLWTLGESGA
ncbi:RICIN domain-containing protein [Streptomyces sp. NPDC018031]|uniref:RICIN domain-containing protein n=1 Tax=Streptomyces sp. NPDC018031 TaxID=3365033 RepID=UPI0037B20AE4